MMTTPSEGPSGFRNPQTNLGGADSVEKTSYVTGHGTEPERRAAPRGKGKTANAMASAGGISPATIAAVVVALLILAFFGVYVIG